MDFFTGFAILLSISNHSGYFNFHRSFCLLGTPAGDAAAALKANSAPESPPAETTVTVAGRQPPQRDRPSCEPPDETLPASAPRTSSSAAKSDHEGARIFQPRATCCLDHTHRLASEAPRAPGGPLNAKLFPACPDKPEVARPGLRCGR
jgi:hypothetical protein